MHKQRFIVSYYIYFKLCYKNLSIYLYAIFSQILYLNVGKSDNFGPQPVILEGKWVFVELLTTQVKQGPGLFCKGPLD